MYIFVGIYIILYIYKKIKHYLLDVSIYSYLLQQQYKNQTNKKSYTVKNMVGGRQRLKGTG